MPRRGPVKLRRASPDPIHANLLVTKLINRSMKDGKKSVATNQIYKAFDIVAAKTKKDALEIFNAAIENIRPTMEVRPRRVGGAAYQVPMPVRGARRDSLAIRWLIFAARARGSELRTYADKLAAEIVDAAAGEGGAVKKRADIERMAESNRAFAHFRW
ncbi:30S ribosomal protein S7 [Candidatus Woesebacteria bacterium RIFCSPHIGHO2_01_FULL_44_10]|uniref:Small ribosomal subunit protein uS7 n=1 Tax=Candidatus Woesebacteria bacterium RIFCSPLOWO2_01_FULL_44_14 TaxID=1802525 RepID=A0A1F8C1E6_9BACT|nr:MAG: 30S ribosomal protein S7 [Candidatus Woesebacteria bacterium RIFCSPHIGHO2_01_FULL_44_10]OGM54687.1 MAG: 30S ribosomal protein S7 [Candidatus Woesebacteria bacterium RIFCSPHIGHO2_12_FULL_44_11]OGM70157.1 MAG: 30S ribosomal protein S7 [Candidatus Woesebacteria bacterium RIFCSPLOWO2_01_FULL_44_14]